MDSITNLAEFRDARNPLFDTSEELDRFVDSIFTMPDTCIRVNSLVTTPENLFRFPGFRNCTLEQSTWNHDIFFVRSGRINGEMLEHFAGLFYLQNPSSSLPVSVLRPQPGETVLDMCASPGSKATQAASAMNNCGTLIANDISWKRIMPLSSNLERLNLSNTIITRTPGQQFGLSFPDYFDRIILDAPCSGEGSWYKHDNKSAVFRQAYVVKCSNIQKDLVLSAYKSLKPGGTLVYSTCTYGPEENEAVVDFILKFSRGNLSLMDIDASIPGRAGGLSSFNGTEFHPDMHKCVRIYAHRCNLPGFFIAKLTKSPQGERS